MKNEIKGILLYTTLCIIIMFVLCALPWYGVIAVSNWYLLLAIPCTVIGTILCTEIYILTKEKFMDETEDLDFFDFFD